MEEREAASKSAEEGLIKKGDEGGSFGKGWEMFSSCFCLSRVIIASDSNAGVDVLIVS